MFGSGLFLLYMMFLRAFEDQNPAFLEGSLLWQCLPPELGFLATARHYLSELSSHPKPVNNNNKYHFLLTYCSGIHCRSSYTPKHNEPSTANEEDKEYGKIFMFIYTYKTTNIPKEPQADGFSLEKMQLYLRTYCTS